MACAILLAALLPVSLAGCRKILTQEKLEELRGARTAAIAWEIAGREIPPPLYTATIERILGAAGLMMVDPADRPPDLLVRIEMRGSWTYERPKPGDWWDSGEVSLIGPGGRVYFRHFFGDESDAAGALYSESKGFYVRFLLMVSRVYGRSVAESEVKALASDPRFHHVPRRVLERLDAEREQR